ncbi:MAG TPA: VOC family protein [Actinomycetota bacterium]
MVRQAKDHGNDRVTAWRFGDDAGLELVAAGVTLGMTNGMTARPPTTSHLEGASSAQRPERIMRRRPAPTPGGVAMAVPLSLGPVHHLRLTVTDVERSRAFYTELLGFQIAMDTPPPADDPHHDLATDLLQDGIVMVNGDLLLGLRPVDADRASDRFDPFRCGLDHLSFAVAGRAELEAAVQAFEERGVEHSTITDLPPFGIAVLPFKDPDGVALELTAPLSSTEPEPPHP